jgi:predicted PurR-regulated permease PerM
MEVGSMLAADYPLLNIFWTISIFFLWAAWIFIVIWVFIDNFRRRDHSGGMKALWTFFIIFVPIFGVLVYLIARPSDLEVVA